MDPETAGLLVSETLKVSMLLAMPLMAAALGVGVAVSVLQALTSLQEQTLVMVPKMATVAAATLVLMPWMIKVICEFTTRCFGQAGNAAMF